MIELLEEKELPRDCASCKYYGMNCADGYSCSKLRKEIHPNFSEGMGYRHKDCPLQSLAEYTKQVRKEVVDDLAISLVTCFSSDAEFTRDEIINWLQKVKDQIQGESK